MIKTFLISFIFLSASLNAVEGVEVTATVDRNQVGVGDVINLTVAVEASDSIQVNQPSFSGLDGFEVISSSSGVETRSLFRNGRFMTEQSRNFSYMLEVKKPGQLTIPPLSVDVDGKSYQTKPIVISASGQRTQAPPQRPQAQQDPFEQIDQMEELFNQMLQRRLGPGGGQPQQPINPEEAFFIQAEVDKTRVFAGEQIVANFYLYTRGQIRDIDTLKYPDLKGFWKEDLEMATRLNFENVSINGMAYQRALLVSYALFPIKAGKAMIDPYKAKCTVITPSNFGFGRSYPFTKASRPIAIEVDEIPVQGRPPNFTGAVGDFRLNAQFEPPTGTANQPVTLRIRIEGRGNAKLIELPKLPLPESFELYDQKSEAKFLRDGTSFKEFEVLIIPRQPGVYNLPAIEIASFDPKSKKFAAIASAPLNLTVTGTATTPGPAAPALSQGGAQKVDEGPKLPPLMTEMVIAGDTRAQQGLVVGVYLALLGFLLQQSFVRFRRQPKKTNLNLVLERRLKKVREAVGQKQWRQVGVELTNAAYYLLGQLSEQGGASQDLAKLLEHTPPSLRNELSSSLQKIITQCEALSFAPEGMVSDMTEKGKMESLLVDFQKVMKRAIELSEN